MNPPIDIFRVVDQGHVWIEPAQDMDEATVRVQSFERGEYLLADQRTGDRVSLCVDGPGAKGAN
jgi:hypothetical protein